MFFRALITSFIISGLFTGLIFSIGDLTFGSSLMYQALATFWGIGFLSIIGFIYGRKIKRNFRGETGTIKWFDPSKGYGFVERDKGGDLFIHFASVEIKDRKLLKESTRVSYVVTDGLKGPQAKDIRII